MTNSATNSSIRSSIIFASIGAAIAATAFMTESAEAKTYQTFSVGAWKGTVQVDAQTGQFTHCTGSARYRSGIKLIFSISRNQKWGVGFSKDSWALNQGSTYNVRYQVDRRIIRSGQATAMTENMAMIRLPGSSRLFYEMRRGRLLKVAAGNDVLKFSLKSTNRLLKSLLRCSVANRNLVANVGNNTPLASNEPFDDVKRQPVATTQNDTKVEWMSETRQRAIALMKEVGVKISFVSPQESPALYRNYDTVWQMGKFMGTMRVFPFADGNDIIETFVKVERSRCEGSFETRSKPSSVNGTPVQMASAICVKSDGSQWSAFYAVYPRSNGTNYMLTAFTATATLPDTLKIGEYLTKIAVRQASSSEYTTRSVRVIKY
ncbi:MAG: hypothetical protein AAF468_16595 [Pseudomonadota bacterium]